MFDAEFNNFPEITEEIKANTNLSAIQRNRATFTDRKYTFTARTWIEERVCGQMEVQW